MNRAVASQRKMKPTSTTVDWFKQFKPEPEKEARSPEIKEDKTLKHLNDVFVQSLRPRNITVGEDLRNFRMIVDLIDNAHLSAADIMKFAIALPETIKMLIATPEFEDRSKWIHIDAGQFISAMVAKCNERLIKLPTWHFSKQLTGLGTFNSACALMIDGDGGNYVGANMLSGTILVDGDVDGYLGEKMSGGTIIVKGNAGHSAGHCMYGGTIHLEGDYKSLGCIGDEDHLTDHKYLYKGTIYHKGKMIVERGRKLI